MKKFISSILLACICTAASAGTIDIKDARTHARKFFGSGADLSPVASSLILGQTAEASPTFYVINNPTGGWLILSAEDASIPVLAYSATGSFPTSGFNPSTTAALSDLDAGIRKLRSRHAVPSAKIKNRWASIGARTKAGEDEVLLETAKWGQGAPFNNLCPQHLDENTVTGCVATAMAIVCKYYGWPAQGTGSTEAYTTDTYKIQIDAIDLSKRSYNWADMPLTYSTSWTSAQKSAVATLMSDCGVMIKTDYGLAKNGGSAATSRSITAAFKKHLSYSGKIRMVERLHMDPNEWFATVKNEIDNGRPLIYSALTAAQEGHAFICDGYDADHMIHINWGWNGECDGFFALTYLGDDSDPTVSGNIGHVFSSYEEVTLGIEPAKPGDPATEGAELFLYSLDDASGIKISAGTLGSGSSFTATFGYMLNNSMDADYSGQVKAVLMDRNCGIKEDLCSPQAVSIKRIEDNQYNAQLLKDIQCKINGTVAPGDAIVVMYTLPDSSWVRMGGNSDSGTISLYGIYDACFIANAYTYKEGDSIYPSLIQGHKAVKSVEWYYDGTLMNKGFVPAEEGTHSLKAVVKFVDDTVETVVHPIKVN